jgi:hypothetical protein
MRVRHTWSTTLDSRQCPGCRGRRLNSYWWRVIFSCQWEWGIPEAPHSTPGNARVAEGAGGQNHQQEHHWPDIGQKVVSKYEQNCWKSTLVLPLICHLKFGRGFKWLWINCEKECIEIFFKVLLWLNIIYKKVNCFSFSISLLVYFFIKSTWISEFDAWFAGVVCWW